MSLPLRSALLLPLALVAPLTLAACGSSEAPASQSPEVSVTSAAESTSAEPSETSEPSESSQSSAEQTTPSAEQTSESTAATGTITLPDELAGGWTKVEGRSEGDVTIGAYSNDTEGRTIELRVQNSSMTAEDAVKQALPAGKPVDTPTKKTTPCLSDGKTIACARAYQGRMHVAIEKGGQEALQTSLFVVLAVSKVAVVN